MINVKFNESSFEKAFLNLLTQYNSEYQYSCGYDLHRESTEILLKDDFNEHLHNSYASNQITDEEVNQAFLELNSISNPSLYEMMKGKLEKLRNGMAIKRKDGTSFHLDFIDFKHPENNIFRVVNQYEVKGNQEARRPDVVIFVNGIPVSVIELKNPADEKATISTAYDQLHTRYSRDIPELMCYSFISIISDNANTRVGSLCADYDFFLSWKSTDGKTYAKTPSECMETLLKGLFKPSTLLNILDDYIYFPDSSHKDTMIFPKYSQYYASELMYENIKKHMKPNGDGKGGTYFGSTGCGKSYTMLFLSRRITRDSSLNGPTVLLLTDRDDLDKQLSTTFENSKNYLIDENTERIMTRKELKEKLKDIPSGGVFLMTIQKFDDDIDLLSERQNIVIISDEAHRTSLNVDESLKETEEGIEKSFGFAKYLRDSFPNATYVGFTGTPIDQTLQVFGPIVCSYKMSQSVADGGTVGIDVMEGPSKVRLDEAKLKIIDKFYDDIAKRGANPYQIEQSKKEMASIRTIIANPSRLDVIAKHIVDHYEKRLNEGSTSGKAMIVCYDRKIGYEMYQRLIKLRPSWAVEKRTNLDEASFTKEEFEKLKPVAMLKLVCTRNPNDPKELWDLLGDDDYRSELAGLYKENKSNFKIVIVVDMWITGFDCPALDTMYVDKPLEKHTLIQTISRVNRVFEGKNSGLIVDYIGLEASLKKAMALYSGDIAPVSENEASFVIFKDQLSLLDGIMHSFDANKFFEGTPAERLFCLNRAVDFVQTKKETEDQFMGLSLRLKKAYDLCIGDERITDFESARAHFYFAIRSMIYKISDDQTPDTTKMNKQVSQLVSSCIIALGGDEKEVKPTNIFSSEYLKKIEGIPYQNTKFRMLVELLRKAIGSYSKVNKLKAMEFSERMKKVWASYDNRDGLIQVADSDVINEFIDGLTEQVKQIIRDLQTDATSFKKLGITFEEKAFYDILKSIRDKFKFFYSEEKLLDLAKKVKAVVDDKSKYIDWLSRDDIKSGLESDIIRVLSRNGYPPKTWDEVYNQILDQVENFKKNQD